MEYLAPSLPTLAVAMIYCVWLNYFQWLCSRHRRLRERVAFLLWSAATGRPDHAPYDD